MGIGSEQSHSMLSWNNHNKKFQFILIENRNRSESYNIHISIFYNWLQMLVERIYIECTRNAPNAQYAKMRIPPFFKVYSNKLMRVAFVEITIQAHITLKHNRICNNIPNKFQLIVMSRLLGIWLWPSYFMHSLHCAQIEWNQNQLSIAQTFNHPSLSSFLSIS